MLERGLAAFTLDEVAERLGLTKPALYYYFGSKDELAVELYLREWTRAARAVEEAVEATDSGVEALGAIVRAYVKHYAQQPELFLLTHAEIARGNSSLVGAEQLQRIRPTNEQLYGGAERRLRDDEATQERDTNLHPRRLAFIAHVAAIGFLTYKTLVESVGDPLRYGDDEIVDEISRVLRLAVHSPQGERP